MAKFKRVLLPYKEKHNTAKSLGTVITSYYPTDDEKTKKASTKIQNLLTQGWRIVSTAPVTGSLNVLRVDLEAFNTYHTFTTGIEVFMVKE